MMDDDDIDDVDDHHDKDSDNSSDDDSDGASTWNMELPNVADLSIDSSTTDVQGTASILPPQMFNIHQFFDI